MTVVFYLKNLNRVVAATDKKKIPKPAEVLQYEKKNAGKKKVKVRDGATGY
jgi:hypothetical protein